MVRTIPASIHSSLNYYVYLYIDPRNDSIFYVGQGKGGRALTHLKDRSQSDKVTKLDELSKLGLEPRIEILRYGLSQEQALHIEAAAIELLGISELTNQVLGHGFDRKRRTTLEDLVHELTAEDVSIKHSALLINISQLYRHGMSAVELYDATRKSWRVGPRREQIEYAMAVHRGVIRSRRKWRCHVELILARIQSVQHSRQADRMWVMVQKTGMHKVFHGLRPIEIVRAVQITRAHALLGPVMSLHVFAYRVQ